MNGKSAIGLAILSAVLGSIAFQTASAQDKSRIPPMPVYQAMLAANKDTGWAQFRNYNGEQWVYFTALQTLHCRLSEIRYSINSEALDETFGLAECNPQNPLALPPDAGIDDIAIRLPPGTAKTIAVQAVWEDGSASAIAVYEPCKDVGEQTCAWPLK